MAEGSQQQFASFSVEKIKLSNEDLLYEEVKYNFV